MKRIICSMFLATTLFACTPMGAYVAADRATYDGIAQEYRGCVETNPTLSPEQKLLRQQLVDSWNDRITAAEKAQVAKP